MDNRYSNRTYLKQINKNLATIIAIFIFFEINAFLFSYIIDNNISKTTYKDKLVYNNATYEKNNSLTSLMKNIKSVSDKLNNIKDEQKNIVDAEKIVANLFIDENMTNIKNDVTYDKIENAKNVVNKLNYENTKNSLLNDINIANELLYEKSFFKLDVNYISQNKNNIYNGCEASCMLMALNYKGYLNETSLYEFANNMPKSDDPNTGFYLSIFDLEPLTTAHWIAPDPLVNFSIEMSGNQNIIDSTGYDLYLLRDEVLNGNPVIIYLTADFKEPYNFQNGVPQNLHVLLLAGYNDKTDEYYIIDPWTTPDGKYTHVVNSFTLNNIYNKVGKKSIIVR